MAPDAEGRIIQAVNEIVGGSERRLTESIGTVRVQLVRLVGRVDAQEQKCVLQHKHMDDKFGGLQTVVDNIQDKQEITGNHEIALLQKKADEAEAGKHAIVKEHKDATQHWVRYVVGGIGALIFALLSQYALMKLGLSREAAVDKENPIVALLGSRKALIMLAAVVGAIVLASLGKVAGAQALEFVKWVVMAWLGAQAVVDASTRPRQAPLESPAQEKSQEPKQDEEVVP